MKNLTLFAAALTATLNFGAFAQDGKVIAELSNVDTVIQSIALTDNGLLKVQRNGTDVLTQQLSSSNSMRLLGAAEQLATAQLVTDHTQFTCKMIIVSPSLSVEDTQTGDLRLVLSPQTCAVANKTHPEDANLDSAAKDLESKLIMLAHQLAND